LGEIFYQFINSYLLMNFRSKQATFYFIIDSSSYISRQSILDITCLYLNQSEDAFSVKIERDKIIDDLISMEAIFIIQQDKN